MKEKQGKQLSWAKIQHARLVLQAPHVEKLARELRSGDLCPLCRDTRLDYDGLLNLACPRCGAVSNGCFT